MPVRIFVTLVALTVSMTPCGAGVTGLQPAPGLTARASATHTAAAVSPEGPPEARSANRLYSLHARRRYAAYLRMRLLEMREAGLARAAAVIERRLPVNTLVPGP